MRHHYYRLFQRKALDAGEDLTLGIGIDVRGCLVEQVYRRIAQKSAGNAQTLALATGKVGTALGNLHIKAALLQHEIVQMALSQRTPQFVVVRIALRQQQVGTHGALEHIRRSGNMGNCRM